MNESDDMLTLNSSSTIIMLKSANVKDGSQYSMFKFMLLPREPRCGNQDSTVGSGGG